MACRMFLPSNTSIVHGTNSSMEEMFVLGGSFGRLSVSEECIYQTLISGKGKFDTYSLIF
jgi:hypothetical protein